MTAQIDRRLLDPHFEIGTVVGVEAAHWTVQVRPSRAERPISGYGDSPTALTYGSYVATVCDDSSVVLGKVSEVYGNELNDQKVKLKCQLLASFSLLNNKAERGISAHPVLGQIAYAVPADDIPKFLGVADGASINVGTLVESSSSVSISLRDLFAKHCAIVGNTGSGKSWSLASIIEKSSKSIKTILLDATGEFSGFNEAGTTNLDLGNAASGPTSKLVGFTYRNLTVEDLFAFFRPSTQAQAPILREAIKTLKLIEAGYLKPNIPTGCFEKKSTTRTEYEKAYAKGDMKASDSSCNFDLNNLVKQIEFECVDKQSWSYDSKLYNYQQVLLLRIENWKSTEALRCLWDTELPSLTDQIEEFMRSEKNILRISLKTLSFEFATREIVVNALCRYLMRQARASKFKDRPTLLAVDEAHNFFKPRFKLGDDEISNEALDIIAKEGRKYGLMLLIATQRPKDIPPGVMSQIGAIVCHRITNTVDAELLRGTVGEFNRHIMSALPTLTQGEAFVTTPSFTFPVAIKVGPPSFEPESDDPI
jgi:uncharacterized protein